MSSQQSNRRIFRIEVGNIPDNAVQDYVQRVKDSFKRQIPLEESLREQVDYKYYKNNVYKRELLLECVPSYKRFLKYNPLHIEEDYFIPLRQIV